MKRLTIALVLLAWTGTALANEECLECHGDRQKLRASLQDPKQAIGPLVVDGELHARSVHADVGCTDCHDGFDAHPHPGDGATMACTECHDELGEEFAKGIHQALKKDGSGPNATCLECHGNHGILAKTERDALRHPLNVHKMCGKCHFENDPTNATLAQILGEKYADDAHAHGLLKKGLAVSATCVACHGGHEILAAHDPTSRVGKARVDETCGACHIGVVEAYRQSVHYVPPGTTDRKGATCTDCHVPHDLDVSTHEFMTQAVEACGRCHGEQGASYRETYHGKVMHIEGGRPGVATCEACHGHHDILPSSDPGSHTHPTNRVETCRQCHEGSHEEFAAYLVHADPHDGEKNPGLNFLYQTMVWLLFGTFAVSAAHALLWFIRSSAAGEWKRTPVPRESRWFRRWPELYSRLHVGMMVAFLMLAGTGLPLHYHDAAWGKSVMAFLGGVQSAGFLHRAAAVLLITVIGIHLLHVVWRSLVKREQGLFSGPHTMLPRWKDAQDVGGNLRWFLFRGPRPRFDRWTYWEKFDYWAVFWGIAVIGGSGVALWFPEEATRLLPGWVLNAAVIVHGHEALLAVGFIFTIHIFHTHFRPEKFPMDTVFFTGRISEQEMREERPLEYARLKEAGTLDERSARRPRRRTRATAHVVGTIALVIGVSLVVAMLGALLSS